MPLVTPSLTPDGFGASLSVHPPHLHLTVTDIPSPARTPEVFGKRLTEAMDSAVPRVSAIRLAARIGVHRNTVGSWRRGETTPNLSELMQLAKILGKNPAWFYSERDADVWIPDSATPEEIQREIQRLLDLMRERAR